MTTTDANGIIRWESTDPITPLEATLNAGMDSVSAAITGTKNGIIHYVANTTERAAKALAFAPSASKPLYVHRADGGPNGALERTTNGTTWTSFERRQRIFANDSTEMPSTGATPMTQAFVSQGTTNSNGVITVPFPTAFAKPPIVSAMTVQGSGVTPVVDSNGVTTNDVRLVWPSVGSTVVRVHLIAIGWVVP